MRCYPSFDNVSGGGGIVIPSLLRSLYGEDRETEKPDVPVDKLNFVISAENTIDLPSDNFNTSCTSSFSFKNSSDLLNLVAHLNEGGSREYSCSHEAKEDSRDFRSYQEQPESMNQSISIVDINWLKEHEQIVSKERVQKLHDAIVSWDAYRLPLLVDSRSGAILDGHHRYAVGRVMGLARLPVVLVDYLNDDSITVDVWPGCGLDHLTKEKVIEMSLSDAVYPPKTSKHDFVASLGPINVPLSQLQNYY